MPEQDPVLKSMMDEFIATRSENTLREICEYLNKKVDARDVLERRAA